ncbi:alpha/beta hydrolase [Spirulina sp. CS-785/01]|uniref:alpha/beta hydrolase n=1 Tax=Spirulina sp. CS-785/01 TaxID=3021716 RepID=UPI002331320E|nr:alpha/beta hydrolase [Spirulina sp. CS-785/01]MDB9313338.1 alpha/beta hydrolase [Spirulina sp. CS-785/01]
MSLDAISIPPSSGKPAKKLLVALHGWGANLHDFVALAPMFNLPDYQFVFPNAPFAHPHVPGGRAWYALESGDYTGLEKSRFLLLHWLRSLEATTDIPLPQTVLIGISQGGAMALDAGLQLPLAGVCSLSGYLHHPPQPQSTPFPPVLLVHGRQDMVVPLQEAYKTKEQLLESGVKVDYHELDMGHEVISPALNVIQHFILINN